MLRFCQIPILTQNDLHRFQSHLKVGTKRCIEWVGYTNPYGRFWIGGKAFLTHRVAYWIATKKQPGEHEVCHKCSNTKCCNPHHLYLDNQQGNIQFALEHGRMACAKITGKDVLQIRKQAAVGKSIRELATQFSLSARSIRAIITHETWKYIGGPITKLFNYGKLRKSQLKFIRRNKRLSNKQLAAKFNICERAIRDAKAYRTFTQKEMT